MSKKKEISRRAFLANVAAGGAACAIVPRNVLGHGFTPPSHTHTVQRRFVSDRHTDLL